jgi:hypothetical protein
MSVTLSIHVPAISAAMASFDVIKVKRSTTGIAGVYSDLTSLTPQHATLQPSIAGPYAVSAKTLQLVRDAQPQVNIVFTGSDPLSAAQLAPQINAAVGAVIASEVVGQLVLTSTLEGTRSKLLIAGGAAAALFGWVAGTFDIGEEAYIPLVEEQTYYGFTDHDGEDNYFYRVQFLNTGNDLTSAESAPFQSDSGTLVSAGSLSLAEVDMIDGTGAALADQEIAFYGVNEVFPIEGYSIAHTRKPITITTDTSGHAEVSLVRGTTWKVVFVGTSFIREFVVPDEESFDLLTVLATAPDPFSIVELQFEAAPRRTL